MCLLPWVVGGFGGLTMSLDGGLEEFEGFLKSLATCCARRATWALSSATFVSSSAIRR